VVMKCSVIWDITLCSQLKVNWKHQHEAGSKQSLLGFLFSPGGVGDMFLWNFSWHPVEYMALYPKRQNFSNPKCFLWFIKLETFFSAIILWGGSITEVQYLFHIVIQCFDILNHNIQKSVKCTFYICHTVTNSTQEMCFSLVGDMGWFIYITIEWSVTWSLGQCYPCNASCTMKE
jgi:hypothetical protein